MVPYGGGTTWLTGLSVLGQIGGGVQGIINAFTLTIAWLSLVWALG